MMEEADKVFDGRMEGNALKQESRAAEAFRRMRRNKGAMAGLITLIFIGLIAVFAPYVATHDPIEAVFDDSLLPPSADHLMGTDVLGRDIYSRVVYGARISLRLGFVSVAIAAFFGTILGLQSGHFGGWADMITMRFVDVMLAFPGLLLAMGIVAGLGFSLTNAMIAVGVAAIPGYTRVVRGTVLSIKENLYIDAAKVIGCTNTSIMFRHILPNSLAPIIVLSTLGVAQAIITGAALSFLGLGAQPPTPEWGAMLNHGREWLRRAWWVTTFPGLAIMITVLCINMLGDGLRDALDPRLKI
jgi:peptide/nickel transport system permease protein